jgi:hypothetical protein
MFLISISRGDLVAGPAVAVAAASAVPAKPSSPPHVVHQTRDLLVRQVAPQPDFS